MTAQPRHSHTSNNDEKLISLCKEVNQYLCQRFGYDSKTEVAHPNFSAICARMKKFDLYLRYCPPGDLWPTGTLVIARIIFEQTRKGHATDFLKFLVSIANQFQIENIAIEYSNEQSSALARRYHFEKIPGLKGEKTENWIISVSALKQQTELAQ